jgi:hypothetical protein
LIDAMELHAARHGCKVCGKSFPCGRSHLSLGEAATAADAGDELKHESSADFGRENSRKKTRQPLCGFPGEEEEEDGESDDGTEHKACRQCGKLFGSWRSLFGHMRSHASARRDRDEDGGVGVREEFVPEETEVEAPVPSVVLAAAPRRKLPPPRRRC